MEKRTVLITGCSSGIGFDSALTLSKRGWRVLATCRQEKDCDRLQAMGLESFVLDYSCQDSIRAGFEEAMTRTGDSLHGLFNNGAYGLMAAVEDIPVEALRAIFEVNFFGYHELTKLVIPVMRKQGYGRIVQNSSILGFTGIPWRGAYNSTKFALEGLTDTLRIELRNTGIHLSLIQPGPISTRIRINTRPHFEKWIDWESSPMAEDYRTRLIPRLYQENGKKDAFELPPSAVTKVLIHALEANRPKARYLVTFPTQTMAFLKRVLPTKVVDSILARQL